MILVIGDGLVGTAIFNYFRNKKLEVEITSRKKGIPHIFFDLTSRDATESLKKYKFVVFTAAISDPVYCEKNSQFARELNVLHTEFWINFFLGQNVKVLFLSSDAVYKGGDNLYDEDSICKPQNVYGQTKLAIENVFRDKENFKSIRLSFVVSLENKFFKMLTNYSESQIEMEVWSQYSRNMVTINDVCMGVGEIIRTWEKLDIDKINFVGHDLVSKIDLCLYFQERNFNLRFKETQTPIDISKIIPSKINVISKYFEKLINRETETIKDYLVR